MTEEIATLPVAGWEINGIPNMGAVLISFAYLSHMTQTPEEATRDRTYVIHTTQARELAQRLLALCDKLESAEQQRGDAASH